MPAFFRSLILLACAVGATGAGPVFAGDGDPLEGLHRMNLGTDLYEEPSEDSKVIGELIAYEYVEFGGCNSDGWCQVQDGWVPPGTVQEWSAPTGADGTEHRILADVDLYTAPNGDSQIIRILREDEMVSFDGCNDEGWCKVADGWAWGEFVEQ